MDEINEYFLELPEHLRHLVAKDAQPKVRAARIELEAGGETIPLMAGAWPLVSKPKRQLYQLQVFLTNLDMTAFLCLSNLWSRCSLQEEYEDYPPQKLKALISGQSSDRIERHFFIEGIDEVLVLSANRLELSNGCWQSKKNYEYASAIFSHQIFASYREFYELSDQIVLERIQLELNNIEKEINLARHWLKMGEEEQAATALACGHGTWAEIEKLYQSLLAVIATQLRVRGDLVWFIGFETFYCEEDISALEARWRPFIKCWQQKIYEHFKPKYFLANQPQPLCISSWNHRHLPIPVNNPTAHELLEAQLHLSQWAHKHCTPAEAATLLPFES